MAELRITISDDKVQLVLDAFAWRTGIDPTPAAFKAEMIGQIKQVVKRYLESKVVVEDINLS